MLGRRYGVVIWCRYRHKHASTLRRQMFHIASSSMLISDHEVVGNLHNEIFAALLGTEPR